jgi:predicted DsbA family dithiol-disulfide isomerase
MSISQSNNNAIQPKKVIIEIWSDIVCPFCYIGKKKMELAIKNLKAENQVEIIWHSFQLDPNFPTDTSISTNEYLVQRKGYPQDQVTMITTLLIEQGKDYNINFQFEKARSFNTLNAHRLIKWAKEYGKDNELKEALMLNYFTKGVDLSITDSLISIVEQVGLNSTTAKQILETNQYQDDVQSDINQAQKLGIRGVPYFFINKKASISGAQNNKVFENTLVSALKDIKPLDNSSLEGICIPNKECK